jgi:CRISPR-associated protein Cas2
LTMKWVVAYDIADDRRRTKVLKILRNFGGTSVQESVVEGEWDSVQWATVQARLRVAMHQRQDTIICYQQCLTCENGRVELGVKVDRPGPVLIVTSAREEVAQKRPPRGTAGRQGPRHSDAPERPGGA